MCSGVERESDGSEWVSRPGGCRKMGLKEGSTACAGGRSGWETGEPRRWELICFVFERITLATGWSVSEDGRP